MTAVGNTALNRRLTFGVRGSHGAARHQAQGLLVFLLGWGITSGSLLALHAARPDAHQALELGVLTRRTSWPPSCGFLLLRSWVFRTRRHHRPGDTGTTAGETQA